MKITYFKHLVKKVSEVILVFMSLIYTSEFLGIVLNDQFVSDDHILFIILVVLQCIKFFNVHVSLPVRCGLSQIYL